MQFSHDEALLLSGAVGGPFTILVYTPLRNAITLGSKYSASSMDLYRKTLRHSLGFTGALTPTVCSCPQFVAMGPVYHWFSSALGSSSLAVLPTAMTESVISYGSQCRNAQLAFNASAASDAQVKVLQSFYNPLHVGIIPHVMRNAVAMSGIRILNEPCDRVISKLVTKTEANKGKVEFVGQFAAAIFAAAFSMPFNQCFNYLAVTPSANARDIVKFLDTQYFERGRGGEKTVSKRLIRDLFMRVAYNAPQLTTFVLIERFALSLAKEKEKL
ncbi:hypothetical protein TeGR_g12591 [Tetraparma gracilis]|uniref:Mitochondrial carrier protein n=1 Tax=Tetraparma gracilis TaxID=2962635 RepID=A0ABQ6MCF4_9STRA|nr:hypothetical protein TeGR_g12591 [Tetraparma gracilis]